LLCTEEEHFQLLFLPSHPFKYVKLCMHLIVLLVVHLHLQIMGQVADWFCN
jgi:hypothetical protein